MKTVLIFTLITISLAMFAGKRQSEEEIGFLQGKLTEDRAYIDYLITGGEKRGALSYCLEEPTPRWRYVGDCK